MLSPICKECGAQVLSLVMRRRKGVCKDCAEKFDAERVVLEKCVLSIIRTSPLLGLTEIKSLLENQGTKIAVASLHNLLMQRLVKRGSLKRSGTRYSVEDQRNVPEKET